MLRDGLKFSDGSPLSGDDFKFTVMATLRSKKTNHKNAVDQIVGAKAYIDGTAEDVSGINVNGKSITVTLNTSFCPALTQVGGLTIIPKSVFGKYLDPKDASKNLDDAPENNAPPVASGAFMFKEWVPNDHVTLVRNDNFWQKANIDEWVHKVYPNQDALTAALKVGEVDIAQFDPKDAQDMQGVSNVQVFKYLNLGYTYIGWNQARGGKEFLQSKAVRQALAYGLNVDQVVSAVLFGEGVKMIAHTPPVSWAYDTTGLNDYKYDPAKAEQLLQQDGWAKGSDGIYAKDGQKLEFSMVTNSGNKIRETFIQVAAEQYKQIGINLDPRTESFEALVDRLNTSKDPKYGDQGGHDFDSYVIGWSLTADPDMYQIWHSNQTHPTESNYIQYKNPDLDKAIEDSRTHCSPAERKAAFKTANQILNEQQPYNFGFAQNKLLGVTRKLQGIIPGPFARQGQARPETWWVQ
jgi:peptide/nickel transport system substrate-binding protein